MIFLAAPWFVEVLTSSDEIRSEYCAFFVMSNSTDAGRRALNESVIFDHSVLNVRYSGYTTHKPESGVCLSNNTPPSSNCPTKRQPPHKTNVSISRSSICWLFSHSDSVYPHASTPTPFFDSTTSTSRPRRNPSVGDKATD